MLLELDGVLVDTDAARTEALRAAFADAGCVIQAADVALDPTLAFGDCVAAIAERWLRRTDSAPSALDETARALLALDAERRYETALATGVTLADGAHDALVALGAGARLGAVTSWRRTDAERVMQLAGLDGVLRFVIARDDGPGFASAARRFARGVLRLQAAGAATDADVVALVSGREAAAAARTAGASPLIVGQQVALRALTPARLVAALREAM